MYPLYFLFNLMCLWSDSSMVFKPHASRSFPLKPLSHQMALPQNLYSVLKIFQHAVGSPQNTPKISKLPVIMCTQCPQCPHDIPTASLKPPWRFYGAQEVAAVCSRCPHIGTQHAYSVLTAIIVFKNVFTFFIF